VSNRHSLYFLYRGADPDPRRSYATRRALGIAKDEVGCLDTELLSCLGVANDIS
jgi:hypothetical protein